MSIADTGNQPELPENSTDIRSQLREKVRRQATTCKKIKKHLERKRDNQKADHEEAKTHEKFSQYADTILANPLEIKKGMKSVILENVHTGEIEEIKLNVKCDANKNAELYYKKARKGKRGLDTILENISETEAKIAVVEEISASIRGIFDTEKPHGEIEQLLEDNTNILIDNELLPGQRSKGPAAAQTPEVPYRHYTYKEFDIYIGRNDTQNDELTVKFSKPWDIWLHVAAHAGSHVLIKRKKNTPWPPNEVLELAGSFAVWFSKARHTSYAEVHLAECRYVTKRRKAPAGQVQIQSYKTMRVAPQSPQEFFKKK